MTQDKTQLQWQPIIEIAVVMIMIFGSNIFLYLHTDSRTEENRRENTAILQGIQQEMKDFHGRLCAIEERNKGK
jgi:hypothetical protein